MTANKDAKALAKNRRGRWLTEQEERNLRNKHIHYADSLIDAHSKAIPVSKNMSEKMRMLATGFLYRGNDGNGYNIWNEDNPVGAAYATGDEKRFEKALYDYYNKRDLSERAKQSKRFLNEHKQAIAEEQERKRLYGIGELIRRPAEINVMADIDKRVKAAEEWADSWKERAGIKAEGGQLSQGVQEQQRVRRIPSWEELPIRERAAYIGAAVRNGIATLPEIRLTYKEFAEGGALSTGSIDEIQETDEANRAYGTNVSLAHIPNTYGGGGSLYGEDGDTRQRQILERAESKVRDKETYNNEQQGKRQYFY